MEKGCAPRMHPRTFYLFLMYMRLLDLFAGTHSVGKVAREMGYDVTSLDLHDADINCDVMAWDYKSYPSGQLFYIIVILSQSALK